MPLCAIACNARWSRLFASASRSPTKLHCQRSSRSTLRSDFRLWTKREVFPCPLCRRSWSISGRNADIAESTRLTHLRHGRPKSAVMHNGCY